MSKNKPKRKKKAAGWTPFEKAIGSWTAVPLTADEVKRLGVEPEDIFKNNRYTVSVTKKHSEEFGVEITHLAIKRNDKAAVHDWRDLQRIKNELCGHECEGIELYPRESRLVDTANSYHIFVFPEGRVVPVGWTERLVMEGEDVDKPGHPRQRPWPSDSRPKDLKTKAEALADVVNAPKVVT